MTDDEFAAALRSLEEYVYALDPDTRIRPFFFIHKEAVSPQDIVNEVRSKSSKGMAFAKVWKEMRGDKA